MTNGFRSVSREVFEMRAEALPLKLSEVAGSISSTDTSEIGFVLPACIHRVPRRPFPRLISWRKWQSSKGLIGGVYNMLHHGGSLSSTHVVIKMNRGNNNLL